jgi:hypothetical protein
METVGTGDRRGASVLLAVVALVVLAACGGSSSPEETSGPAETTTLAPTTTEDDVDDSADDPLGGEEPERPGCAEYCQTAGGYGGEGTDLPAPVEVELDGTVTMYDDGTIPVRVTCTVDVDCAGAILTTGYDPAGDYGRCDLFVPAGETRLLAIPLPDPVADLVYDGESVDVAVTFDTFPTVEALGNAFDEYLGLLVLDTVVTGP